MVSIDFEGISANNSLVIFLMKSSVQLIAWVVSCVSGDGHGYVLLLSLWEWLDGSVLV